MGTDEFVGAVLAAPAGVTLLARLEARAASGSSLPGHLQAVTPPEPSTIGAAGALVHDDLAVGGLLVEILLAVWDVGPWNPAAVPILTGAYAHAHARRSIAEAIADRFAVELHRPVDLAAQEWWTADDVPLDRVSPLFEDHGRVYCAGQFTWAGLWTVTAPPPEVHKELVDAWELHGRPVGRWSTPARADARIHEIHGPRDWVQLVAEFPRPARPNNEGWELPGVNQHRAELRPLLEVPGQNAARGTIRRHLVPDWTAVAGRYDGVHLSWAGLLTSEGCVSDVEGGDVTMLRYWFSERTLWLNDVFDEPSPMSAPALSDGDAVSTIEATQHGAALLRALRGR